MISDLGLEYIERKNVVEFIKYVVTSGEVNIHLSQLKSVSLNKIFVWRNKIVSNSVKPTHIEVPRTNIFISLPATV